MATMTKYLRSWAATKIIDLRLQINNRTCTVLYLEHGEVLVVGHNIPCDVHLRGSRHGNKLHPFHIAIAHLKKETERKTVIQIAWAHTCIHV